MTAAGVEMPVSSGPIPGLLRVLGNTRFNADGGIVALCTDPAQRIWTVDEPGSLRHWDPAGVELAHQFLSDLETLWTFSPDAEYVASASDDLTLWRTADGAALRTIPQHSWVTALAFDRGTTQLATGHDDGNVLVWQPVSSRLLRRLACHDGPVSSVAFSADGRLLATSGEDKLIKIWDLATGELVHSLDGHPDRIQTVLWHPREAVLASAGWDATVRIWRLPQNDPAFILNYHANLVTALAFSPDGRLLASADSEDVVYAWDTIEQRLLYQFEGNRGGIHCLAFQADGGRLYSGGDDGVVRPWELSAATAARSVQRGRANETWTAAESSQNMALSADGTRLAACGPDGLQVWNATSGEVALAFSNHTPFLNLAYSPDGRFLAGGTDRGEIWLRDAATGKLIEFLHCDELTGPITALVISPDSRSLAAGSALSTAVCVWSLETCKPVLAVPDFLGGCGVETLAFNRDSRMLAAGGVDWLATGGSDGRVVVWDIVDNLEIITLEGGSKAIVFHPRGDWLAVATLIPSICLWNLTNRQLAAEWHAHEQTICSIAFGNQGRLLATGGDDRHLCLWDAETGELLADAALPTQIKTLAFSPTGQFLYTGNRNLTCYQLDVPELLRSAQS